MEVKGACLRVKIVAAWWLSRSCDYTSTASKSALAYAHSDHSEEDLLLILLSAEVL